MSGLISAARTSLLGLGPVNWVSLGISAAISIFLLLCGVAYFRKTERFFADVL
jgi:lipopolysaccharide transport system permease protein